MDSNKITYILETIITTIIAIIIKATLTIKEHIVIKTIIIAIIKITVIIIVMTVKTTSFCFKFIPSFSFSFV